MLKYIEKEISIKDKAVIHKYLDTDNGEFIAERVELVKGKLPIYIWSVENKIFNEKYTDIVVYCDTKYKECYVSYKALQMKCHRFGAVINSEELNIKSFYTYEFLKNNITTNYGNVENIATVYVISDKGNIMKEYHLTINSEIPEIDYSNIAKVEFKNQDTESKNVVKKVIEDTALEKDTASNDTGNNITNGNKEKIEEKKNEKSKNDSIDDDEDFDIFDTIDDMIGM